MRCASCTLLGKIRHHDDPRHLPPPENAARLEREAQERGVSAEDIVAKAVEAWIEAEELDWNEDERRLT